jgi:hypothetical protein
MVPSVNLQDIQTDLVVIYHLNLKQQWIIQISLQMTFDVFKVW